MGDDLQEDIRTAMQTLETPDNNTVDVEAREIKDDKPLALRAPEEKPEKPAVKEESTGKPRDESGKFAPSVAAKPEEKPEDAPIPSPAPPPGDRAPVSWKPAIREKWKALPAEVQQEVLRRERETDQVLNESAQARRMVSEFQQITSPYEMFFRQEGVNALQATDNLMRTAAALRTSAPPQKAQLVADMIMQFGVDTNLLDQMLTARIQGGQGRQQPQYDPGLAQLLDQRLQPIQQFMTEIQQRRMEQQNMTLSQAQTELDMFLNDPANEFAQDVRQDMADLLELSARRGQTMSLQDAYSRATLAHPQIGSIMTQRRLTQAASQQSEAAKRAKNASASLPSGGAPSQGDEEEQGDDIRSALVASVRQHASR